MKLTLRDLFWLTLAAALCCALFLQHKTATTRLQQEIKRADEAAAELAAEQVKKERYRSALNEQINRPSTPAGQQRKEQWDREQSEYREAYFYLREFAPTREPDEL